MQFHCAVILHVSCVDMKTRTNLLFGHSINIRRYIIDVKVGSLYINKKIIYVLENYSPNNALRFK